MKPITIRGKIEHGFLLCDFPHFKNQNQPVNITITPVAFSLTPAIILQTVADLLTTPVGLIISKKRKTEIVFARYIVVHACVTYTAATVKEIGLMLGGRDHSTIVHAKQSIAEQLEIEEKMGLKLKPYTETIKSLDSILKLIIANPSEEEQYPQFIDQKIKDSFKHPLDV